MRKKKWEKPLAEKRKRGKCRRKKEKKTGGKKKGRKKRQTTEKAVAIRLGVPAGKYCARLRCGAAAFARTGLDRDALENYFAAGGFFASSYGYCARHCGDRHHSYIL